jgi:hypothetical protein
MKTGHIFRLLTAVGTFAVISPATGGNPRAETSPAAAAVHTTTDSLPSDDLALAGARAGLSPAALEAGVSAWWQAVRDGLTSRRILTIIDYTLPSAEPRLWVMDLSTDSVLAHELVAHGRGSGNAVATRFSNRVGSNQTSLGAFLTAATYHGSHGLSLRLQGLEAGQNDRAMERAIVIHGAWYVSPEIVESQGRLGRSLGCPALSETAAPRIIDMIRDGTVVYAWHAPESLASS